MSMLNPTITVTGIDEDLNRLITRQIAELLKEKGYTATVRVETAEIPHRFNKNIEHLEEKALARYDKSLEESTIMLNGLYTVSELDGLSYKLRKGQ